MEEGGRIEERGKSRDREEKEREQVRERMRKERIFAQLGASSRFVRERTVFGKCTADCTSRLRFSREDLHAKRGEIRWKRLSELVASENCRSLAQRGIVRSGTSSLTFGDRRNSKVRP